MQLWNDGGVPISVWLDAPSPSWKRKLALKVSALFALALVAVTVAFFIAPTDRTWPEIKRALEARGEVLDWEKMIPPPIPAEENLFDDPVAASLLPLKGQPVPPNPLGVTAPALPPGSEDLGFPFALSNLVALPGAKYDFTLAELNEWFAQWDESFVRLRAAANRPKARLHGDFTSPFFSPIPNFVSARTLAQVLASRAKVHLLLGNSPAAFDDLETLQAVMKSFEAHPGTLVSAMIHVAIAGLYLETIEDGLRHNLWADAELQKLTPLLLEMNLFKVAKAGIRAERAGVLRHLAALAERKRDPIYKVSLDAFTSSEWTVEKAVIEYSPSSWIRATQAQFALIIQGYLDGIDAERRTLFQARLDQQNAHLKEVTSRWSPRKALLLYVTPNFSKATTTVAKNQMRSHELSLACALHRYRLKSGSYPERLDQLVPAYLPALPNDVWTGRAMRYELRAGGYALLTSTNHVKHPNDRGNFIWKGE